MIVLVCFYLLVFIFPFALAIPIYVVLGVPLSHLTTMLMLPVMTGGLIGCGLLSILIGEMVKRLTKLSTGENR